jgi:hypothetical protein
MLEVPLKLVYSSIQDSDVLVFTVTCKLIKSVLQKLLLFIPEVPAGFLRGTGLDLL